MEIVIKIGKKQPKGKWIKNTDHGGWHCSVCGHDNYMAYVDYDDVYELQDFYCPHCGAQIHDKTEYAINCPCDNVSFDGYCYNADCNKE